MERVTEISQTERIKERPNLSMLALISFIASFAVARTFTTLYPDIYLTGAGHHIHHFWYGLAMLAVGGWLGINYENERINRLAAILFGAGGGIIGDEVGLLLTFGDYWTEITYTFVIVFLTLISIAILFTRYSKIIRREFSEFLRSNASLYVGVFLVSISIAFILETDNLIVISVSSALTITACIIILIYFVQRITTRH